MRLEKSSVKVFESLDKAREGNQDAVDSFRKLGITFNEIKMLEPEQAIRRVVESLSHLQQKDPVAYVVELRKQLGRGGLGLDAASFEQSDSWRVALVNGQSTLNHWRRSNPSKMIWPKVSTIY